MTDAVDVLEFIDLISERLSLLAPSARLRLLVALEAWIADERVRIELTAQKG